MDTSSILVDSTNEGIVSPDSIFFDGVARFRHGNRRFRVVRPKVNANADTYAIAA